jgi:hypothetical protein
MLRARFPQDPLAIPHRAGRRRSVRTGCSDWVVPLFGFDPDYDRLRLRALRAAPPGLAARSDKRHKVFAAALGQFDELLTAAGVVGPASAPLPLYYALSQAGRAIAAAFQSDPKRWQPTHHGLKVSGSSPSLGERIVTPVSPNVGMFRVVTDTIKSPPLTGPVRLSALWAAAPEAETTQGLGERHRQAVPIESVGAGTPSALGRLRGQLLEGLPPGNGTSLLRRRIRSAYPAAREGLHVEVGILPGTEGRLAELYWRRPDGTIRTLDDIAPPFPVSGAAHFLIPGLGPNEDVPAPLMIWWAVLYALSHLARYQPAPWADALDPVHSTRCVPIEAALAWIREVMPALILRELLR